MMKNVEITVSFKIEKLHEDMIKILKYFGKFTLIDSDEQLTTKTLEWTDEIWEVESNTYTYLYEYDEKDEEIVKNCLNVAYDGDFLN
jgi:hypothetical protein